MDQITSRSAKITWQLKTDSTLGSSNILDTSTWHIEYGSASGDYRTVSESQYYIHEGPHGSDPRSITLTGLNPNTAYYFRVVMDVKAYNNYGNLQPTYSDPNNTFTTAAPEQYVISKAGTKPIQRLEVNGTTWGEQGGTVDTWESDGALSQPNQTWTALASAGGIPVLLQNSQSKMCLQLNGTDGKIDQWPCADGAENHQWQTVQRTDGTFALEITLNTDIAQWKAGTYYLGTQTTINKVTDGTPLTLLTDINGARTSWRLLQIN